MIISVGKTTAEQIAWKTCFAWARVRIGTRADGKPLYCLWERYEERWTGDGDTGSTYHQRRLPGDGNPTYSFGRDRGTEHEFPLED